MQKFIWTLNRKRNRLSIGIMTIRVYNMPTKKAPTKCNHYVPVRKGPPKCKNCKERLMGEELNGTLCTDCLDQESEGKYWRQAELDAMPEDEIDEGQ
jgi:hypothetical protein